MTQPRTAARARPASDYPQRGRECAFANLKLMSRAMGSLYDEVLEPCGLRASELALLWAIVALGPAPMSALAAAALTDATTLSRTVLRLCETGLCTIRRGDDRRTRIVATTALGRRRFRAAMPHWERAQALAARLVPLAAIERLARHCAVSAVTTRASRGSVRVARRQHSMRAVREPQCRLDPRAATACGRDRAAVGQHDPVFAVHERLQLAHAVDVDRIRGLTLCSLDDLGCEALPIAESTAGAWTLGAGAVWYLDISAAPPTLARYDLGEKRVTLRTPSRPTAFGRTIAVSPDGAHVLLAREAPTLIDLMIAH